MAIVGRLRRIRRCARHGDRDEQERDEAHRAPSAVGTSGGRGESRRASSGRRMRTRHSVASSKPPGPSDRAAYPRAATAPPSAATRAAVTSCSSWDGCAAEADADEQRGLQQEEQPDPDAQDVAPGGDRHDGQRGEGKPGRLALDRTERRRPEPVGPEPDDERRSRRAAPRSASRAASRRSSPPDRGPRSTAGRPRGSPPTRRAARPSGASSGSAEERSNDQRGGETDDREAAIARGDRDHRSGDHHRARPPRGRGSRRRGSWSRAFARDGASLGTALAPGRSASGQDAERRRTASSAATRDR